MLPHDIQALAQTSTSVVRTWPWAFLATQDFKDELLQLFPWADKQVDEPWYRERTVGNFTSEHGQWSIEDQSYEFDVDFDDWFKELFGSMIAPYATTSDGRTALWRLELKLNAEGHEVRQRVIRHRRTSRARPTRSAGSPAAGRRRP